MLRIPSVLCASLLVSASLHAQDEAAFGRDHVASPQWRILGPANMGGRVTDIEVHRDQPSTYYVGTAGGGLLKSTNAGTTWTHLFTDQSTNSIGDVAVAPSNPDVVWVGSGEENARNSVSWGDGVYKSTDAGKTFKHMGLAETFQIGHIAIHPTDADVVFVAALGRLWGHNAGRGVYRTKDGGETWERVLFLDEKTGCMDVRIDPKDPSIVYACMYERMRDEFDSNDPAVRFGEKSGFFKSTDGGDTWTEITAGLPSCSWGRSGLTIYDKDPSTLYMIIETERSGWASGSSRTRSRNNAPSGGSAYMGINGENAEKGARLTMVTPNGPSAKAGLKRGDVIVKVGDTDVGRYTDLIRVIRSSKGGEKASIEYMRGAEKGTAEITWGTRAGAAAGSGRGGGGMPYGGRLGGQQANVQDDQGDDGFETGGIFRSDDHGDTWKRVNSLTDRPFYYSVIAVDPRNDQNVYSCGVPFFGSDDGGKEFNQIHRGIHVDFHACWVDPKDSNHLLLGGDGGLYETFDKARTWRHVGNFNIGQFYNVAADNADPYNVYGGLQDNGTWGGPSQTRWREGSSRSDWVTIYGGDGFRAKIDPEDPRVVFATSQNGGMGRLNMATGGQGRISKPRDAGGWNWNTPFFLSPHNSRIFYFAGRKACRSLDRGANSVSLSPELGLTDRGTATAFAESPREAGTLMVGTDDGALWRSLDDGRTWEEIHEKVVGLPGPRYVSSIEFSHHNDRRVFVTFDGHRSDDFETHVYVSEDQGDSWKPLRSNIEGQPARTIVEDPRNANLLFLGTEFGCWVSLNRGKHWEPLGTGLPTVAVHELVIQDRENDLIAGTHGRGVCIVDITPLRQMEGDKMDDDVILFRPQRATMWKMRSRVTLGHEEFRSPNPEAGATVYLYTKEDAPKGAKVTVHDVTGKEVGSMAVKGKGLHRLQWSMRGGGTRGRFRRGGGATITPGNYSVRYKIDDETTLIEPLTIRPDPQPDVTPLSAPVSTQARRN